MSVCLSVCMSVCLSVAVRKVQVAILARSSREIGNYLNLFVLTVTPSFHGNNDSLGLHLQGLTKNGLGILRSPCICRV